MEEILDDQFLDEKKQTPQREKWFHLSFAILILGSLISTSIAWVKVESIIGSGPTMSVIGIIVALFILSKKGRPIALLGFIPLALTIFWVLMINLFSLSPSDCRIILPLSLSFASALILIAGIILFLRYRN